MAEGEATAGVGLEQRIAVGRVALVQYGLSEGPDPLFTDMVLDWFVRAELSETDARLVDRVCYRMALLEASRGREDAPVELWRQQAYPHSAPVVSDVTVQLNNHQPPAREAKAEDFPPRDTRIGVGKYFLGEEVTDSSLGEIVRVAGYSINTQHPFYTVVAMDGRSRLVPPETLRARWEK